MNCVAGHPWEIFEWAGQQWNRSFIILMDFICEEKDLFCLLNANAPRYVDGKLGPGKKEIWLHVFSLGTSGKQEMKTVLKTICAWII